MGVLKGLSVIILLMIFVNLSLFSVTAQEFNYVASNSEDWKDVFSSIHYANLNGLESGFLVSTAHGDLLLSNIPKSYNVLVVSSRDNPYVFNYASMIRSRGFAGSDEIVSRNINLDLLKELPDVSNFIVVDSAYGFSAVAVVPYAIQTGAWVLFVDSSNVFEVDDLLSRRTVNNLMIYGYVDRQVRDIFEKYSPVIIDNNDKFRDNVEIVKLFLENDPSEQVILTNGEFLENEIMKGIEPNLFTGKQNVPDQIRDYLKNSDIKVGVLIGNDLVGAATNIRRSAGISVMVKFARGARSQSSGVAAVEGLDLFPIPVPSLNLGIHSLKYNRVTNQLEITYLSESNVPVYFKGTLNIFSDLDNLRVGDLDPIFIAPGDYKTIMYPLNLTSTTNLKGTVYTLFGETASSLDRVLEGNFDISVVEVIDRCILSDENIKSVRYNKQKKSFYVKISNPSDVDCWVDIELLDIRIGYLESTLSTEGSYLIPHGKTRNVPIYEELSTEDLDRNPFVDLLVYSGEREDSLVNMFSGKYALSVETLTVLAIVSIILLIVIILLIIFIFFIRRRDEEY